MTSVITRPAVAVPRRSAHPHATPNCVDARLLFETDPELGHKATLYRITVDGVVYISDSRIVIRAERLTGLAGEWAAIRQWRVEHLPALSAALRDDITYTPTRYTFDPQLAYALWKGGAGLRPLAGDQHVGPWHAVVIGDEKIGIARPLKITSLESAFGVIPGLPPTTGSGDTIGGRR